MKKLIKIVLIAFFIFSNISISPATAKENTSILNQINEDLIEEYKLYAEKADDKVSVYLDETLEDELFELEENISVLVTKEDLETSLEEEQGFVYITLNPENEEIPEELVDEIEKVEDIQGFVYIETLVELENEAIFLEERETNQQGESVIEDGEQVNQSEEQSESEHVIEDEEQEDQSEEQDGSESVIEDDEQEGQLEEQKESEPVIEDDEQKEQEAKEDLEEDNKKNDISVMRRSTLKQSKTSQLAHIYGGGRLIYKTIGGNSFKATGQYQNAAYYVKREAQVGRQKFYLLSKSPSATRGVIGWMKAEDISTRTHSGVTNAKKQLRIKGIGKATSKAWGGNKDTVHSSMSRFKGQTFHVNLTEKVGGNTWHRGKINEKGANVWLHSSQTQKLQIKESKTSQLAHIYGGGRLIYKTLGGNSFKATGQYQNVAYYVKREAEVGGQKYYLLSKSPSATRGVVGWMKAGDVSTRTHKGVTNAKKQLTLKGTGKATSKAWGGSKDTVHSSMSRFKGQTFHVNLTEKVGSNTWYRGKINGKGADVWLHSSQTQKLQIKESKTSQLAHIYGGDRLIYKTLGGNSFKATGQYQNVAYYVKREAEVGGQKYYLLSKSPSATRGVVGWIKAEDVSTRTHSGVTNAKKQLAIKGPGKATSKAWGGSKDTVHSSMSRFKGQTFHVNLTEKVGGNTWHRGKVNGKGANVWLHSSQTKNSKPLIVLDPGHGGKDPGASGNGVIEKHVVLDVTKRVEKILKARGYNVIMTRQTDIFIELKERSNIANRNNASSFLSIHANSGGGIGTETWWFNRNNAVTSKRFAQAIQNGVINTTKARDRGIKHGNLSVNRESKMTSALLEIGFVDSITDARNLKKASYKNKIAKGVANGFDNYYK